MSNVYEQDNASAVADVEIDRLISFGDSYSDVPRSDDFKWVRKLTAAVPSDGLDSFAVAGAKARDHFNSQVNRFFRGGGTFSGRDLTSVYLGYNDVLAGGPLDEGKSDYRAEVRRLIDAGATADGRRIFLALIHDISKAPDPISSTEALVDDWNEFVAGFANSNSNLVAVDLRTAFDRIVADPARFGFTNVTTASSDPTALYQDRVHFGERGQQVIAEIHQHYLTRGWDWANTVSAGSAGATRLNQDIDNGLVLGFNQETGETLGLAAFTFGDLSDRSNTFDVQAQPAEPGYRTALGFTEQDGGAGLRYKANENQTFGFAVGRYGTGFAEDNGIGGNQGAVETDGVALFWQQGLGGLQFDSRFVYGKNEHTRRERDGLVGEATSAHFEGDTTQFSQRLSLPLRQTGGWFTPWAEIVHQNQSVDTYKVNNIYLTELTYQGENVTDIMTTFGFDAAVDPFEINDRTVVKLQAGMAYSHALRADDYQVSVREASTGLSQSETVAREVEDRIEFRLGSSLDIDESWGINLGYVINSNLSGNHDQSVTTRFRYRF